MKQYRQLLIRTAIGSIVCAAVIIIFQLWWWFYPILLIAAVLSLPPLINVNHHNAKEEKRFEELTAYMEQMICSYKRNGQAVTALIETKDIFLPESCMGKCIQEAITAVTTGRGIEGEDILREGLRLIERKYNSRRLTMIHLVISHIEKRGGQREEAMDILLEELQLFRRRMLLFQKKRKHIKMETVISIIMSAIMCYISKLLTPQTLGISLSTSAIYQWSTVLVFIMFLGTYVIVQKKMKTTLIDEPQVNKDKKTMEKYYQIVKNEYTGKCSWLTRKMAFKIVKHEVEQEYPNWMLYLIILLKSESVYNAVKETLVLREGIFYLEVENFLRKLYEEPAKIKTFSSFFEELSLPELHTAMRVLYSIGTNGYEQNQNQLTFLLSQNNVLTDRVEKNRDKEKLSGMSLVKNVPMLIASLKLLIDLVNLLKMILTSFSQLV